MAAMPPQPPPGGPAPEHPDDPGWPFSGVTPDWVDEEEWARMCATLGDDPEPPDPVTAFYDDPDCGPPPEWEQETWETLTARAEKDGAEYEELIGRLAGQGYSESAHVRGDPPVPGSPEGPAAGFGQGRPLDEAAPSTVLCGLADEASGEDRAFTDVTDDQLMGLVGVRQRIIARQDWEQLTAVAEFIRRRPHPDVAKGKLVYGMPEAASDDAAADLAAQLHVTASMAAALVQLAWDLMVKLPLTRAALRDGIIDLAKARGIAMACLPLTPGDARRAERILFGLDVEEMTAGMIRDRIGRAVMEVDPGAARRRREEAERTKRVEVFPELSGNTHISGRELPPAAALAASQNLDARARELRAAGVPGDLDNLRALAYLEMLGAGSPLGNLPATGDRPGGPRAGAPGMPGTPGGGVPGQVPPGFAANVNLTIALPDLTIPLLTLLGLAERPGMMSRAGPVDPALARILAAAAARDPHSTWCVTVTGADHRPVAHGCGRSPPRKQGRRRGTSAAAQPRRPGDSARDGPAYQPGGDHDPPGTGTTRLNIAALTGNDTATGTGTGNDTATGTCTCTGTGTGTGTGPAGELVFELENLAGPCDHKWEAAGHDPGVKLRHLTGILNPYCTFLTCRCPHRQSDYEHSTPFEKGGRTCLCEGGPVCRHHHRDKQAPGWHLEHGENRGWFRWTTASRRTYTTRPTQYPD